jgi:CubicO group peptidase (beta-lactamase class C family)
VKTLFMIGSTTKPLTMLMLAKLVGNDLGNSLQKVLPDFTLADQEAAAKFLLKHSAYACTGIPRRDFELSHHDRADSIADIEQSSRYAMDQ